MMESGAIMGEDGERKDLAESSIPLVNDRQDSCRSHEHVPPSLCFALRGSDLCRELRNTPNQRIFSVTAIAHVRNGNSTACMMPRLVDDFGMKQGWERLRNETMPLMGVAPAPLGASATAFPLAKALSEGQRGRCRVASIMFSPRTVLHRRQDHRSQNAAPGPPVIASG
jgi:hypothetical protein